MFFSTFFATFLHTAPQQVWLVVMTLTCGYALWRGQRPERVAGGACIAAWVLSTFAYNYRDWLDPQWFVLLVDLGLLAVLLALAMRSDRTWALFAAAFQLLAVVIHIAIMIDSDVRGRAYVQGLVIWSYLIVFSVGLGTWFERRRVAT
ncbi:hypothetical protein [Phenylobacterium sp.]|uniref:hypothetical protein n=1 Tax=Phenylobacterium sp. TaxID=1871053 RepID=UPI00286B4473|nr:hypothetical protein [Phenylobacterium sp.]